QQRKKYYREKQQAAKLMDAGMKLIHQKRLQIFGRIDPEHDPTGTGMIGSGLTPITSKTGSISAKQTSANPNFAAVMIHLYKRAGLKEGDVVAMAFSGSFPSLNLAALVAAEVLKIKPIPITSLSASRWGANDPQLTWLDMERLLFEKGIIHYRSVAASLGGETDQGRGIPPEGIRILREVIKRNGVELIDPPSLESSWDLRVNIYEEEAKERAIACYINIGGGAGSVGTPLVKRMFKEGLNKSTPSPEKLRDSVMSRFSRAGVPVINMINVSRLATRYGLPIEPEQRPEPGEGGIFAAMEYNIILTWSILIGLISAIFILLRMDFSHYFLRIRTNLKSNKLNSSPPPPQTK
ncbi:MAG: poly-gamma-glutamate system protein, partial [Deltaproteobacteria bacterium]|nr:poly-gamma-glutamate system protein [Deltaproteobacteria bacterium]